MDTKIIQHFIFVDDDEWNNRLCEMLITNICASPNTDVQTFTDPEAGLEYIKFNFVNQGTPAAILFLDINMPTMTGWEFLEEYEKFDEKIKKQLKIFILSSSIDQRDEDKASQNIYVSDFIVKPLTIDKVLSILAKLQNDL